MEENVHIDSQLAQPGSTIYMPAPALRKGLRMPARTKAIIAGLGLLALLVAGFFGMRIHDSIANAPARYAESINEAITSGPGLELPVLNSYIDSDNAATKDAFRSSGYTLIDVEELYSDGNEDENSLDVVKIPKDMNYDDSVALFKNSLRRANVLDAAHYLAGSWRFTAYRSEGVDLKVKYSDLQSETIEEAITNAIAAQGWSDSNFGETGVDQSGNTFQSGSIMINDRNFNWTVSACPLDEVYSVNGLPENSFYVGARLVS